MNASQTQNENSRKLNLVHGKVITINELNLILKSLNIKYNMFIDEDTINEFIDKTGFSFNHNYNNGETYTLTNLC